MEKFKNITLKTIGLILAYNIVICMVWLLILALTSILEAFYIIKSDTYVYNLLSNIFFIDSIGIIVFLIYLKSHFKSSKESLYERCNFKPIKFSTIVYIIIFTLGVSIVLGFIIDPLAQYFPSYKEIEDTLSEKSFIALLNIIVLGPIAEEIIFRGVLFNFLRKNFKLFTAVIVQALVFGIFHGNWFQGMYAFILGLILALVYIYTDSIYGSITMHMACNAFGGFINPFLSDFLNNTLMNLLFLLLGVICLIFGAFKIFGFKRNGIKKKTLMKL